MAPGQRYGQPVMSTALQHRRPHLLTALTLLLVGWSSVAKADEPTSLFEQLWNCTNLYENDSNPILQHLHIIGRAHGQYHWSDGPSGDDDDWETRRFRLGLEAKMFSDFTLKVEAQSAPDFDPWFNGFSEVSLVWHQSDEFNITIGKHPPRFSYDYWWSTKYHPYLERNILINMFAPDRTPGVSFTGKVGRASYLLGVYSNSPSDDVAQEFANFDGGGSGIASLSFDMHDNLHLDGADLRFDYLHTEHNANSEIYTRFSDGAEVSLALRDGRAVLNTLLLAGFGSDNGDVACLSIMPGWYVSEKLLLVARYQLAASNDDQGINSNRRYERSVGLGRGDRYQAGYVGFNYFLYGCKARLMGGVEYANMNGRDAWTGLLGIRLFWDGEDNTLFANGDKPFTE